MRLLVIDSRLCLWLGICSGVMSVTIAKSKICLRLRQTIAKFSAFGGELVSCPYCVGHWTSLLLVILYAPYGPDPWWRMFWLALGLCIAISSITAGIIIRLFSEDSHAD